MDLTTQRSTSGGEVATRLWRAWSAPELETATRLIVLAACALLFLEAAGTFEVVYTVRPSDALFVIACGVGAPIVIRGWLFMPASVRWLAIGLVAIYVLATLFADTTQLPTEGRSSGYRSLVYLANLLFGLAVLGLIYGLWERGESLRPLVWCLFGGAVAAAAYGIYQWFAQRHGLALADINNAVNTDGISYGGGHSQGAGLLGGERIRGTFVEPTFLAAYLASMLPLALLFTQERRGLRWAIAGGVVIAIALLLTASAPAWAELGVGVLAGVLLAAMALGRTRIAVAAGVGLAISATLIALAFANPGALQSATGRSATELENTTKFRVDTWDQVIDVWETRPVIGYGPGQGAVKLARRLPSYAVQDSPPPLVLGTASGLWAASLLDGGVLAFVAWIAFLVAILYLGGRAVLLKPSLVGAVMFAASVSAVAASEISGDRLGLRVWVLLGVLLAVSAGVGDRGSDGPDSADKLSPNGSPA